MLTVLFRILFRPFAAVVGGAEFGQCSPNIGSPPVEFLSGAPVAAVTVDGKVTGRRLVRLRLFAYAEFPYPVAPGGVGPFPRGFVCCVPPVSSVSAREGVSGGLQYILYLLGGYGGGQAVWPTW